MGYSSWTREEITNQRKLYTEQEQYMRQTYLSRLNILTEEERQEYEKIVKEAGSYDGTVKMKRKFVELLRYEIDHGIVIVNVLECTQFTINSKVNQYDPEYCVTLEFKESNNPERGDWSCWK